MRLAAALLVVFCHYTASDDAWGSPATDLFPGLHDVTQYGWVGVEVFFLISGFVICMSSWGKSFGDFVVSRVTRLYPAYWIAVVLAAVVVSLWPAVRQLNNWTEAAVNLTMLQEGLGVHSTDGVYWTLFVELKFYLLFGLFVVVRGVDYRRCVMFCALWTVAGLAEQVAPNKLLFMWTEPFYSPYFCAGIALYLMYRFKPTALLVGITLISFVLAEYQVSHRVARLGYDTTNVDHRIAAWPAQLIVAAAFLLLTLIALGVFDRIQWRWLSTAGALTYPLYLLHQDIGLTALHALKGRVGPLPLVLGMISAMMLLAYLVQRFLERPLSSALNRAMKSGMAELRYNSAPAERRPTRVQAPAEPERVPEPV
ncbi:Putative acyltransferase [Kitasatospora sp. MMS16-BH015]|nr:Putative acyltransferase [Kitasatospora sp. MMS16-BH015]